MRFLDIKTNLYLLTILGITSVLIAIILYILTSLSNSNEQLNRLETSLEITRNILEEQKRYALSLSILLSEDKEIVESFLSKNREESFKIINRKIQTLKNLQNSSFQMQIHHKDLSTYLRSWDFTKKDISLDSFRQGLVKVKKEKKPLVSIELGKRLNIKAISPIFKKSEFVGSIETIIDFEYLSLELKQKGYSLFVLLDEKYLNIANELKSNPIVDNFVLVNKADIKALKGLQLSNLKDYGYISNDDFSFSYFSYYDFLGNNLGYIFCGVNNEKQLHIHNAFEYKKDNNFSKEVTIQ